MLSYLALSVCLVGVAMFDTWVKYQVTQEERQQVAAKLK
jgi:hypothetical protein